MGMDYFNNKMLFFRNSLWKTIPNLKVWQQINTFALGKYNIPKG